jgi:hypothetical protein
MPSDERVELSDATRTLADDAKRAAFPPALRPRTPDERNA